MLFQDMYGMAEAQRLCLIPPLHGGDGLEACVGRLCHCVRGAAAPTQLALTFSISRMLHPSEPIFPFVFNIKPRNGDWNHGKHRNLVGYISSA